jgi:hypothetical protein
MNFNEHNDFFHVPSSGIAKLKSFPFGLGKITEKLSPTKAAESREIE